MRETSQPSRRQSPTTKIFISYRRDDSAGWAGRIYDGLSKRFGSDSLFMDINMIQPGLDFVEIIQEAIGSCYILLAIIGPHWLTSTDAAGRRRLDDPEDFVRLEIATALDRGISVIPVLVHGATMPRPHDLPHALQSLVRRQALEVSDVRWSYDLGQLIRVLEQELVNKLGRWGKIRLQYVQWSKSWLKIGIIFTVIAVVLLTVVLMVILKPIPSPTLLYPSDGSTISQPYYQPWEFRWDEPQNPGGVQQYHLLVTHKSSPYPIIDRITKETSYTRSKDECSCIVKPNLLDWRWKVQVQSKKGNWSSWSKENTFNVEPVNWNIFSEQCPSKKDQPECRN